MKFKKKELVFVLISICLLSSIGVFAQDPILDKSITAGETALGNFITYEDSPHQTIGALQSTLEQETTYEIKNLIDEVIYHNVETDEIQNYELVLFPSAEITDESLFNSLTYPDVFLVSDDGLSTTYNAEIDEVTAIPGADDQPLKNIGDIVNVDGVSIQVLNYASSSSEGDLLINSGASTFGWLDQTGLDIPTDTKLFDLYGLTGITHKSSAEEEVGGVFIQIIMIESDIGYSWLARSKDSLGDEPWEFATSDITTYYGFSSTTDNYDALAFATEGNYDVWVLI